MKDITDKLNLLHNKIDSIYSLLETLSNRLNRLEYSGEITYGEPHHIGRKEKSVIVKLRRAEKASPNPHGDDDYATPKDIDIFPGP